MIKRRPLVIKPRYSVEDSFNIIHGDCLKVLPELESSSIDAVVCDPPYELNFMGKGWDNSGIVFQINTWRQILRVMKPGAHLASFGGSRTFHRMACAIEDAGFDIRDTVMWLYGTGFPKSHDISKGIDRKLGAERSIVGHISVPATPEALQRKGWGTALKPAFEPIIIARKPLDGTVAENTLKHGVGGINIDGCRIPTADKLGGGGEKAETAGKFTNEGWRRPWMDDQTASEAFAAKVRANVAKAEELGRWPANVLHDGSDEVLAAFAVYGESKSARFFYSAKADKMDRDGSTHPTVKPVDLLRYLCRLVTPPNGLVLDPFAGSGTTLEAARCEGFRVIGIEQDGLYCKDIERRMSNLRMGFFAVTR